MIDDLLRDPTVVLVAVTYGIVTFLCWFAIHLKIAIDHLITRQHEIQEVLHHLDRVIESMNAKPGTMMSNGPMRSLPDVTLPDDGTHPPADPVPLDRAFPG